MAKRVHKADTASERAARDVSSTALPDIFVRLGEVALDDLLELVPLGERFKVDSEVSSLRRSLEGLQRLATFYARTLEERRACWRCGASQESPPIDVDLQVKAWAWRIPGWRPEDFARKCREVMQPGDTIVNATSEKIFIRRADGIEIGISRFDD